MGAAVGTKDTVYGEDLRGSVGRRTMSNGTREGKGQWKITVAEAGRRSNA